MVFNTITGSSFKIHFELRNKTDGSVALTKSYNVDLKAANVVQSGITGGNENSGGSSITGGIINEGTDDEQIMTPDNDTNISNSYNSSYEKMSLQDLINNAKGSFDTFKTAFSILPGFVWASILILLGVCIALRILGR